MQTLAARRDLGGVAVAVDDRSAIGGNSQFYGGKS